MKQVRAPTDLATVLDHHRRSTASRLSARLLDLPGGRFRTPSAEALADWVAAGVEALVESIRSDSPAPLSAYADELGRARDRLHLGIDDAAQALLLLKEAALEDVLEAYGEDRLAAAEAVLRIDEILRLTLARYAARELDDTRRLHRVTASFLDMHSLREVLEIICNEAQALTGAQDVTVELLAEDGDAPRLSDLGSPDDGTSGTGTGPRETLLEAPGRPQALARGRAALTLPLRVKDHDVGTLLLTGLTREPVADDLGFLRLFSSRAAIAIEHALYHEQKEQLAALEERQKLAHDLHDSVTQSLYGVTMYGEAAARQLDSGNSQKAGELLRQLRETSLEALREARLLVFELRSPLLDKHGLAATLQARLAAVEGRTGLETRFSAAGVTSLSRALEEELLGICTEALNNSLKHARASQISVRLLQEGPRITLEVTDDGRGFDRETAARGGGLGLVGMRERAARLGAQLSVDSRIGEGTRIRVTAPLGSRPPAGPDPRGEPR